MTQTKLKHSTSEKTVKMEDKDELLKQKYFSEKCVQIVAWILLILGLCIIVSTFYLAIKQRDADVLFEKTKIEFPNAEDIYMKNGRDVNVNIMLRIMDDKIVELEDVHDKTCELKLCKIICTDMDDFYSTLFESMEQSNCNPIESLVIHNENLEDGVLRNNWHYSERTVQELAIINSNITFIRTAAFNSSMFSMTFLLYWQNLNLRRVGSGALLGLFSLKYLMIDTKIDCLDRAFFQPVQTTLIYLKLNAEIEVSKDESIFGVSRLKKLEYADLSRNNFNGILTRTTFANTPNLRYLIISGSKLTVIMPDAFAPLAGKLFLLDLSNNLLTTLRHEVLAPLLQPNDRVLLNLAMNNLICDCEIRGLRELYKEYRKYFMHPLYCKAPHSMYGKFIDQIDVKNENCHIEKPRSDENDFSVNLQNNISEYDNVGGPDGSITLRCLSAYDTENDRVNEIEKSSIQSKEHLPYMNVEQYGENIDARGFENQMDYFDFERPQYEFELYLYENFSVRITVPEYDDYSKDINILWFAENIVESSQEQTPCLRYENPFVITDPLENNKTYTFCYVYSNKYPISPFNCLPLHVPAELDDGENIWISDDQKPFTIGMLFLIFIISVFAGTVIAYFGIKAYPDLLEGSKNVLVVKKSDQTCNVSTISENDYIHKSSLRKQSSNSRAQKASISTISDGSMSDFNVRRGSSVKSSSTCFEDAFPPLPYIDDDYELPKPCEKSEVNNDPRSIPNMYAETSPYRSPPPLPKRNSFQFSQNVF